MGSLGNIRALNFEDDPHIRVPIFSHRGQSRVHVQKDALKQAKSQSGHVNCWLLVYTARRADP